jgi:hypothetical protein
MPWTPRHQVDSRTLSPPSTTPGTQQPWRTMKTTPSAAGRQHRIGGWSCSRNAKLLVYPRPQAAARVELWVPSLEGTVATPRPPITFARRVA